MKKIVFVLFLLLVCYPVFSDVRSSWNEIKTYILKSEKCMSFDKIKFLPSRENTVGENIIFKKDDKDIKINFEAQIPYKLYYTFIEELKKSKLPYVLVNDNCGEVYGQQQLSFSIPEMHYDSIYESYSKNNYKTKLKIFPLFYRNLADSIYEVVVLTTSDIKDSEETLGWIGETIVFSFIYDENEAEVLSSLILCYMVPCMHKSELENLDMWSCSDNLDFAIEINNNVYKIFKIREGYGMEYGVNEGVEIYILSSESYKYERIWSSLFTYPDKVPSSVLDTIKNIDHVNTIIHFPMAYECEILDSDGYTNVREKPNVNSDVLFKIKETDKFIINGFECNGWYKVLFVNNNVKMGWINKSRVRKLLMLNNRLDGPRNPLLFEYKEYDIFYDDF